MSDLRLSGCTDVNWHSTHRDMFCRGPANRKSCSTLPPCRA
jgi:hypothetical protein